MLEKKSNKERIDLIMQIEDEILKYKTQSGLYSSKDTQDLEKQNQEMRKLLNLAYEEITEDKDFDQFLRQTLWLKAATLHEIKNTLNKKIKETK